MSHKHRITIEILASGQPRAYADNEYRARVSFEATGLQSGEQPLVPQYMSEEAARRQLLRCGCNFIERLRKDATWPQSYLDWLRPVDPKLASEIIEKGDPKQTVASTWEFQVTTPYTD